MFSSTQMISPVSPLCLPPMRHGDTNVNVDTLGCLLKPLQLGQRWLDARGEDGVHHELFVHESLPAVPVALRHLEVPIVGDLSSNGVDFLGFPLPL